MNRDTITNNNFNLNYNKKIISWTTRPDPGLIRLLTIPLSVLFLLINFFSIKLYFEIFNLLQILFTILFVVITFGMIFIYKLGIFIGKLKLKKIYVKSLNKSNSLELFEKQYPQPRFQYPYLLLIALTFVAFVILRLELIGTITLKAALLFPIGLLLNMVSVLPLTQIIMYKHWNNNAEIDLTNNLMRIFGKIAYNYDVSIPLKSIKSINILKKHPSILNKDIIFVYICSTSFRYLGGIFYPNKDNLDFDDKLLKIIKSQTIDREEFTLLNPNLIVRSILSVDELPRSGFILKHLTKSD